MKTLREKAILVKLSMSRWGSNKTDQRVTEEVIKTHSAGRKSGKFVKELIPNGALDPIEQSMREMRRYFCLHSLPWKEDGWRIVPSESYMKLTSDLRNHRQTVQAKVDEFVAKYEEHLEVAKTELNGMFNPADYPTKDQIRGRFAVIVDFAPIPDHTDFRIQTDDEIRQNIEDRIKQAEKDCERDLWTRLSEPLKSMVARLSDTEKNFKNSLFDNLKEVVELIPSLDIIGDPKLEEIRKACQEELVSIRPSDVRDDDALRARTAAKAKAILDRMGGYR